MNQRTCQLCEKKDLHTIVDGATRMGPWAYMCYPCFTINGRGLGLGRGQLYNWDYDAQKYVKVPSTSR